HAVADDDLRALGDELVEAVEVDALAPRPVVALAAAEDDGVVDLEDARLRLRRQPQLRTLQVEQQADRATGALRRRTHRRGPPAQVIVRAVRAVQARAVD